MKPPTSILLLALLLNACTMAPTYERPAAPVSSTWPANSQPIVNPQDRTSVADMDWHGFFTDTRLQKLIELSLLNNRDLRVAVLNVEKVQAQYRIVRSQLFPELDAGAGYLRQRIPRDIATGSPNALYQTQYSVSADITAYELDLFGRVRSMNQSALEQYFASVENRKSAQLTLISEVAMQYLTYRQMDEQLRIAKDTLAVSQAFLDAIQAAVDSGVRTELDLQAAVIQVQTAKADMAQYQRLLEQAENALVLLVGMPLPANLPPAQSIILADLNAGLPSDLLLNRPDIQAAEHILKSANADIGAARAAFFPRILLTGQIGTASAQLSDLFTGPSYAWNFAPQITVPIFDGGRNLANLDVSKVSKRIEIANYEKSIQSAFREVADALAARANVGAELMARKNLVEAQQKRYDLSDARYQQGVDNYLTVLTAQQDLYTARQSYVITQYYQLTNQVALYKALGGGYKKL